MADQWYCSIRGDQSGPMSSTTLKRLADSGDLSRSDLIWKTGLPDWVAASTVKGLFPVPSSPPPPPRVFEAIADLRATVESLAAPSPLTFENLAPKIAIAFPQAGSGLHVQRIGVGLAAAAGVLATFLPWVTAPIVGTVRGTSGPDGWITLAMFVPALVLSFLGSRESPLGQWQQYVAAVPAGLAAVIGGYKVYDLTSRMSAAMKEVDDNPLAQVVAIAAANTVRIGTGIYLLILAGAAVVAAVFALRRFGTASR